MFIWQPQLSQSDEIRYHLAHVHCSDVFLKKSSSGAGGQPTSMETKKIQDKERGRERNNVYSAVSQLNRVCLSVRCRHQMGGQTAVILIRMIKPKRERERGRGGGEFFHLHLNTAYCVYDQLHSTEMLYV